MISDIAAMLSAWNAGWIMRPLPPPEAPFADDEPVPEEHLDALETRTLYVTPLVGREDALNEIRVVDDVRQSLAPRRRDAVDASVPPEILLDLVERLLVDVEVETVPQVPEAGPGPAGLR